MCTYKCMFMSMCVLGFYCCEDTMTKATLIKENISLELAYSFRGLVHYHHGGKHGSVQADMVLDLKEARRVDSTPSGSCV